VGLLDRLAQAGNRTWILGCGGLALLILGGLSAAILSVADFPIVALRVNQVAAEYRAAGLPWKQDDMSRHVPADKNASPEFLAEMSTTQRWVGQDNQEILNLIAVGNYQKAGLELDQLQPEIQKFVDASRAENIAFEKDWDQGVSVLFPEYAKVKAAVKLLVSRAEVKAAGGDLPGAFDDLRSVVRISKKIGQEPNLIGLLVGIATQAIVYRSAENIAALHLDDASWILRVRRESSTWNFDFDMENALKGESYFGVAGVRNLIGRYTLLQSDHDFDILGTRKGANVIRDGVGEGAVRQAYLVRHMEVALAYLKARNSHHGDILAATAAMDRITLEHSSSKKMSNQLSKILYPNYKQAGMGLAKSSVIGKMSEAALRAGEMKVKTGKFPISFEELGMEPIIDPSSKEPMHIRVKDDHFYIYMVGFNGRDEGGVKDEASGADDVAVQFPPKVRKVIRTQTSSSSVAVPGASSGAK
jgi:hypothetical protein